MRVASVILGALAVLLILRAASWTAAHAIWLLGGLLVLAALWLFLWHQRRMGELYELHNVVVGRYRQLHVGRKWPKGCRDCGASMYKWWQTRAHDNAETSPCMILATARHAAETAPTQAEPVPYYAYVGEGEEGDQDG